MVKYIKTSNHRGIIHLLNYDALLEVSESSCLVCLTERDRTILLSLLQPLVWRTRYYSNAGNAVDLGTLETWQVGLQDRLMADRCAEIIEKLDTLTDKVDVIDGNLNALVNDFGLFEGNEVQDDLLKDVALAAIIADLTTLSAAVALDSAAIAGIAFLLASTSNEVHDVHLVVDAILDAVAMIDCSAPIYNLTIVNNFNDNLMIQIVLAALAQQSAELPGKLWIDKLDDGTDTSAYAAYCALINMSVGWIRTVLYRFIYVSDPANSALGALYNALLDAGGYFTGTVFDNAAIPNPPSTADAVAAAEDDAAVLSVACDLTSALLARGLAFEEWRDAVYSLTSYADPSNEKVIADLLIAAALLDTAIQANYAGWITAYPAAYANAYAANPTSFDDCGCVQSTCEALAVDFALGEKLPFIFNRGVYAPGTGITATLMAGDGSNYGIDMSLRFPVGTCQIANVTVSGKIQGGGAGGNRAWVEWYHDVAGVETLFNESGQSSNGLEQTWTLNNPAPANYITRFRFRTNSAIYGTSAQTITWAIFHEATMTPA